jgi:23S rRNA (pseudouridine1915-N3)-methyltransferase
VRYRVVAIGKLRRGFYAEGCAHYASRLRAYAPLELHELREGHGQDPESVKQQEAEALLGAAKGYLIALDERAPLRGSGALAERITALEVRGISQVSLLIGGAAGLSEVVRRAAGELWSLSALTLPHELARLVLLEQLYRLETIRAGHPYHRG